MVIVHWKIQCKVTLISLFGERIAEKESSFEMIFYIMVDGVDQKTVKSHPL